MNLHPSLRFEAPTGIQSGVPLKNVVNKQLVGLLSESLQAVLPDFNASRFEKTALKDLDALEFTERGLHVARALATEMPQGFDQAGPLLIKAMGPELTATEGNGLAVFFYLPHSYMIAEYGLAHFDHGMQANYELTKRMTAEFSIRPFIVKHQEKTLKKLMQWTKDPNPHVRRLVSEGSRARLPWASRLVDVQKNPQLTLPLLEALKDDPELYVRRSVANHLGDILKDHLDLGLNVAERWLEEVEAAKITPSQHAARRWIVRHALRLPAKKSDKRALSLRKMAGA